MSRRIYVDLDDVLAQTGRMLLRVLEREFGRTVAFEDIRSYHLGESFDLGPEELDKFMKLAHEPEALSGVEPMPGAAEALAGWRESGYEILVVTGRPPATLEVSVDWLDRSAIPYSEIHFLDKYSLFYGGAHGTPEGALALDDLPGLDLCLAVEDFPSAAGHIAGTVGVPVALFDRPWNRELERLGSEASAPILRCADWTEIRERFPAP